MTSSREAKCWMVAAMAVVVWACTLVGCAATSPSGSAAGVASPSNTVVFESFTPLAEPVWKGEPLTLTADTKPTAAFASPATVFEAMSFVTGDTLSALPTGVDAMGGAMPSGVGAFEVGLRGLTIARPLLSAKRLLIAGVTQLHRLTSPWPTAAELGLRTVANAGMMSDRPLAAAVAITQRLQADTASFERWNAVGFAMTEHAWQPAAPQLPTSPPISPTTPTLGAAIDAEQAKFDAAGVVGIVLGGLVLLFGGEAVVLWLINRRRAVATETLAQPMEDDEPSIFRIPEPIKNEAQDTPMSRAA